MAQSPDEKTYVEIPFIEQLKGMGWEQLEVIVQNVVEKTNTGPDEFDELDLSRFSTIDEQLEFLKNRDRIDTMYIM